MLNYANLRSTVCIKIHPMNFYIQFNHFICVQPVYSTIQPFLYIYSTIYIYIFNHFTYLYSTMLHTYSTTLYMYSTVSYIFSTMLHIYSTMLHIYSTVQRLHQELLPGKIICLRDQINPQMYRRDGLKIRNLDLRGLGRNRNLKAALDFSGGSEMRKAVRLDCLLNMLIWNAAQK